MVEDQEGITVKLEFVVPPSLAEKLLSSLSIDGLAALQAGKAEETDESRERVDQPGPTEPTQVDPKTEGNGRRRNPQQYGEAYFFWSHGDKEGRRMQQKEIAERVGTHAVTISHWVKEFKDLRQGGLTPEEYLRQHHLPMPYARQSIVEKQVEVVAEEKASRFARVRNTQQEQQDEGQPEEKISPEQETEDAVVSTEGLDTDARSFLKQIESLEV